MSTTADTGKPHDSRVAGALRRTVAFLASIPAPTGPLPPLVPGRTCAFAATALALASGALLLAGLPTMLAAAPLGLAVLLLLVNYPWLSFLLFMLTVGLNWTIANWPVSSPTKIGAGLVVGMTTLNLIIRGLRPRLHWMHLWLLAFAFWSLVSANATGNGAASTAFSYTMIGWVLVLICASQLFQGAQGIYRLFSCYAVSAAAGCVVTISTFGQGGHSTLTPVAGDPNDFGMLAASGTIVSIGLAREKSRVAVRLFWLLCALACLTVTVGSLSRGSIMGLGAALLVHFAVHPRDRRAIIIGVLAVGILAAIAYPFFASQITVALNQKAFVAQGNVSSRFDAWTIALHQFVQHPLTGTGIGSLQDHYIEALHLPPGALALAYSHNTYIEILYGTGLIGAILMLTAIGWSLWIGWRAQRVDPEVVRQTPWLPSTTRLSVGGVRGMVLPAIISVLVACLTVTEIMYPPFWMAFVLAMSGAQVAGKPGPEGQSH